ncbi:hypothetical protein ACM7UU_25845 [Pseudomonas aeruginosa]
MSIWASETMIDRGPKPSLFEASNPGNPSNFEKALITGFRYTRRTAAGKAADAPAESMPFPATKLIFERPPFPLAVQALQVMLNQELAKLA